MSFLDDDRPKKPTTHEVGCDLTLLSADELAARMRLLQEEMARLQAEIDRKNNSRKAAEGFFRS